MSMDANDLFGAAGVSCKFPKVGHSYKGTVVSVKTQQQRDMETDEPKTWDNGDPMIEVLITMDTDENGSFEFSNGTWSPIDVEDDDGRRVLYAKGGVFTAVKAALRAAKSKIEPGGVLEIKWVSTEKASKKGYNDRKVYAAKYTPGEPEDPFVV